MLDSREFEFLKRTNYNIFYGSELKLKYVVFLFKISSYLVTDCVWGVDLLEYFERLSFYEAMTTDNVI